MNPPNDFVIGGELLDPIYLLYEWQHRYEFLNVPMISDALIWEVSRFNEYCRQVNPFLYVNTLAKVVIHLSANWQTEFQMSRGIYDYEKKHPAWLCMCVNDVSKLFLDYRNAFEINFFAKG